MTTTARRLAVVTAATLGLLLAGAGTALADPGASAPQGPITLTPEQATRLCTQRIPLLLSRIERVTDRIGGDASTPGSTAWLQVRLDRAEAAGRTEEAERLRKRIGFRPERLDRLADVEARVTAFRDANCAA